MLSFSFPLILSDAAEFFAIAIHLCQTKSYPFHLLSFSLRRRKYPLVAMVPA
jgi:hypothetical protein